MTLDHKFELAVRFSDETKHKGLYSWCLKECDKDGVQKGEDQIPWTWGLNFIIPGLHYHYSIEQEPRPKSLVVNSAEPVADKPVVRKRENFYGRLVPAKSGPSAFFPTRYSFFGTEREIAEFSIQIVEGETEGINIWGSPEFDIEPDIDQRSDTSPDTLHVTLIVRSDRFRELVDLFKSNSIERLSFWLCGADGFYSAWSPSISVDKVKVLARDEQVQFPDQKERSVPSLGEVSEYQFRIDLKSAGAIERSSGSDGDERYDVRQDPVFTEKLKSLLRRAHGETNGDESEEPGPEESAAGSIDTWRYSPLIQQFSVIYNQARASLIRSGKSNQLSSLFGDIGNLAYSFRRAVGQDKTDKKNLINH
jgi:hypothetical protein